VVAFIVTGAADEIDTADLDAHLLARIARFKRPKRYLVVASLPKNSYGKVLKKDLRQQLV
jgi:acyl-CoA synthetase (AMP-forming)/AMP-acid ligase II